MTPENKLYRLGKLVGLGREEIDEIIQTVPVSDEQLNDSTMSSLQYPMDVYGPGTLYGTVSINDFQ